MLGQLRKWGVLIVAIALEPWGCTYLRNRGRDAAQMIDLGFTVTKKPRFGIYANCPLITPVGYSKLDGYYVGLGGGKFGVTEHHQDNQGLLLWGKEKAKWGSAQEKPQEDEEVGVVGIAKGLAKGEQPYKPACKHYLHLGWIGVAANANYYEMLDFLTGWAGFDLCHDDLHRRRSHVVAKAPPPPQPAPPPRYPLELLVP